MKKLEGTGKATGFEKLEHLMAFSVYDYSPPQTSTIYAGSNEINSLY